ncbi:MAG: cytochrome c3 family protein [Thiohalobacterales bacterium]|nr:cytochrome c3 family protein [Thiohalobacterales bacterium]
MHKHPVAGILPVIFTLLSCCAGAHASGWRTLESDSLHDPGNPALEYMQDPAEALSRLPGDSAGNKVDWVRALRNGYIRPRSQLMKNAPVRLLDTDILLNKTGSIPRVRFPHKAHTEWLDCGNCHDHIFKSKAGATPITMGKILEGEYCGVCHGAVAFPLTECSRCHSVPWEDSAGAAADSP